jgi:hypothetical protein
MRQKSRIVFGLVWACCGGLIVFLLMSAGRVKADCYMQPCAEPPCCNGDVNGDGRIEISDAVYLLYYLFGGYPEPQMLSCCRKWVPATGATQCWSTDVNPRSCNTPAFPGEDAFYKAGCPTKGRFVDNGDGTITDNCTGLMWQKESAPNPGSWTWQNALKYCDNLKLAGYEDWRLPNIRELLSMVDYGRLNPCNDPVFQSWGQWYWSSTTWIAQTDAWAVFFFRGESTPGNKFGTADARAVRGGLTQ